MKKAFLVAVIIISFALIGCNSGSNGGILNPIMALVPTDSVVEQPVTIPTATPAPIPVPQPVELPGVPPLPEVTTNTGSAGLPAQSTDGLATVVMMVDGIVPDEPIATTSSINIALNDVTDINTIKIPIDDKGTTLTFLFLLP